MSKWEDIGFGILLDKIRFPVAVCIQDCGHGFKVAQGIRLKNCTPNQLALVDLWINGNDLPELKNNHLGKRDNLTAWLDVLEPYENLLTDQRGLTRLKWVRENPMPSARARLDTFLEWAAAWDEMNDGL